MIRLTLLLCAGLFAALQFGGEDRGQVRFGLVAQPKAVETVAIAAEASPAVMVDASTHLAAQPVVIHQQVVISDISNASFVPEKPVMVAPAVPEQDLTNAATTPKVDRIMKVNANSANVRGGPGTDYSVMGKLTRGEAVMVVADAETPEGWSHIRIEGDGIDGFIATRLLTE